MSVCLLPLFGERMLIKFGRTIVYILRKVTRYFSSKKKNIVPREWDIVSESIPYKHKKNLCNFCRCR